MRYDVALCFQDVQVFRAIARHLKDSGLKLAACPPPEVTPGDYARIRDIVHHPDMATLLPMSRLVFCEFGAPEHWQAMQCGTPTVTVDQSFRAQALSKILSDCGIGLSLGDASPMLLTGIEEWTRGVLANDTKLKSMGALGLRLANQGRACTAIRYALKCSPGTFPAARYLLGEYLDALLAEQETCKDTTIRAT